MGTDTAVAVLAISGAMVAWIFNLVRRDRLYVGYGLIFAGAIAIVAAIVGLSLVFGARQLLRDHIEGFAVGGSAFVVLILVYTLSQVTLWSNRLTTLTQELAIRRAEKPLDGSLAPQPPEPRQGVESIN